MQKLFTLFSFVFIFGFTYAQKNKDTTVLKGEEANALMKSIFKQAGYDTAYFLKKSAAVACKCIDSVDKAEINAAKKTKGFSGCIDNEVSGFEMSLAIMGTLNNDGKHNTIVISPKNSDAYKKVYYKIERYLKDSCEVLTKSLNTNDEERDKSYSKDPEALAAYNKGLPFFNKEDYATALPYFENAVGIDPEFAFAWDNIGVCYRRLGQYDKAEEAYKNSLEVDPSGITALQNLPLVYKFQNKNKEAIAAYNEILKYYPNNPEVYYGIGVIYFENIKDMELALDNMCKAYNLYVAEKSPFRTDAEKIISMIYNEMKAAKKEKTFNKILKQNNITPN